MEMSPVALQLQASSSMTSGEQAVLTALLDVQNAWPQIQATPLQGTGYCVRPKPQIVQTCDDACVALGLLLGTHVARQAPALLKSTWLRCGAFSCACRKLLARQIALNHAVSLTRQVAVMADPTPMLSISQIRSCMQSLAAYTSGKHLLAYPSSQQ